jgi:hypothetical protein
MPSNYPPGVTDRMIPGNDPNDIDNEQLFELYADAVAEHLTANIPPDGWEMWLEDEIWTCYECDYAASYAGEIVSERYEEELYLMKQDNTYRTKGISDKAYIAVLTQTEKNQ